MKVIELQGKYPSTMIAGSLVAQALRIYKTILNDEEFESMIDAIAKSQSKIEPYYKEVLH
jgi:hypothetical protein